MTDTAQPDDDWLTNPAPPPRSTDPALQPAPKADAAPKPAAKVTRLRPLEALANDLENPPRVAGPAPDGQTPDGPAPDDRAPPDDYRPDDYRPDDHTPSPPPPRRPHGEIWDGCPVRALGVLGKTQYLLDIHGQLRAETKIDAQTIMSLFGNLQHRLYTRYPTFARGSKTPQPGRFEATKAATDIFNACADRGLFNPDGAVRGVGAWADDDGNLIYHTGDRLLMGGQTLEPLTHQGRIYPAYDAIPHPAAAEKSAGKPTDPVPDMLATLESWAWSRPDIDPQVVLGMIGVQMMGGALSWRPTFWNTGPRAAGKSSFQTLLKHLHGAKGLIQSNDATKSGITSRIGHSSLPVALDELEPGDEGSSKERDIIVLARVASSGGEWMRGSADQKGASGNVYSTFFFSSILIPGALKSQDLSRLVVLSMMPLPEGTPPIALRAETWRKRGAALKRMLVDRWPSWGQRLDLWRDAFAEYKVSGRAADNYATIMAMAQMAQSPDLPTPEELSGWAAKVARWVKADLSEIGSDADEVTTHLLSQVFDPFRKGERFTVATWLKAAGWRPGAGARLFSGNAVDNLDDHARSANKALASLGLRVIGTPEEPVLFVATKPLQGLKDLFQRSQWAGGAWTQSLQRIKGARPAPGPRYLDGSQTRGTEVPFTSMPGLLALDGDLVQQPAPVIAVAGPDDLEEFL